LVECFNLSIMFIYFCRQYLKIAQNYCVLGSRVLTMRGADEEEQVELVG
jgi:hypothetical protein